MSHVNIQHPKTGMWRCWSTVIDGWVSDWMSEADYKEYLIQEAADSMREDLEHFGIRTTKFRTYNDCIYDDDDCSEKYKWRYEAEALALIGEDGDTE